MKKKILFIAIALIMLVSFAGCSGFLTEADMLSVTNNPTAVIVIEYEDDNDVLRQATLVYELFYSKAPGTVANFIQLSQQGYYNDKLFHRVTGGGLTATASQYMTGGLYTIQADGVYKKDTSKGYKIKGEFLSNGWEKNDLVHQLGSLVMDRDSGENTAFDTASTAFYISLNDNNARQDNYAVFGQILSSTAKIKEGEDWVTVGNSTGLVSWFRDDMLNVSSTNKTTNSGTISAPKQPITIKSVTIDTKGVDYSKAKVAKA